MMSYLQISRQKFCWISHIYLTSSFKCDYAIYTDLVKRKMMKLLVMKCLFIVLFLLPSSVEIFPTALEVRQSVSYVVR
jgi:hypothetical protein